MKKETLIRIIAFLLLGALLLGFIPLAALAAEVNVPVLSSSIGIIGGADGPTAILITGNPWGIVFTLFLIAGGICGVIAIVKVMKKRSK